MSWAVGKQFSEIQPSSTSKLVISQVFPVGIFIGNTTKTGNSLINARNMTIMAT